ncbi:MAG TPA: orotidine-5'-phosphate decarboxylase [Methylophilaceae bacterium]|nr:orotidine-5'-phosphate decarboxylase [Methylophilaceae bacterium]
MNDSKIVIALDYTNAKDALSLVNQLDPSQCKLKVGKELYTATGPALVEKLVAKDFKVFLDLKFHDIPNTVKKACKAASDLGVWMLNVHASGGSAMMEAALEGVNQSNKNPYLIAVTVLTSMNQATLSEIGNKTPIQEQVLRLATLTQAAGLHGVVCSAQEASLLRQNVNPEFLLVTPGIRPTNASKDDQSRIMTPPDALRQGASYLVIGRPITQAEQPQQALQAILQSIQ